jgi:probable phosphoglycerate mutase
VSGALNNLLRKYSGMSVLVACHGGVVDAVLRLTMQTPPTGAFEVHTKNCSITELVEVRAGHFAIMRYNDHAHLHGLPLATNNS